MSEKRVLPEYIREDDLPLFLSVQNDTKEKLRDWIGLQIKLEKNSTQAAGMKKLMEVMDESISLNKILRGEKVTATCIKSYGAPWFDLVEHGEDICSDAYKVSKFGYSSFTGSHPNFKIDGETWRIDEVIQEDEEYILHYEDDPEKAQYRLIRATKEDIDRLLHPRLRRLSDGKEKYSWKLQIVREDKDGKQE